MRLCPACKIEKPREEFNRGHCDGIGYFCRACEKEYHRRYYQQKGKANYQNHCEEIAARSKAYRHDNSEHCKKINAANHSQNNAKNVWPLCLDCNMAKRSTMPSEPYPPHVEIFEKTGT